MARNMVRQGQATKERRPWITSAHTRGALKGRYICRPYRPDGAHFFVYQGPRAPLRFALAPGFYIPRRWRSVSDF